MHFLFIIVFVAIGLIVLAQAAAKLAKPASDDSARVNLYYLRESIFSSAERSFYGVLESLDYESVTIVCKVRLADIFGLKKGLGNIERQRALNRISAKHVDFLLLRQSDGHPLLGIELDDSSHEKNDRQARDQFVDGIFFSVGLPILRVPVKPFYDPNEIHRLIDEALSNSRD